MNKFQNTHSRAINRIIGSAICILMVLSSTIQFANAADKDLTGHWKTPPSLNGTVRIIEIRPCGSSYCMYLKGMGRPGQINTNVSGKIKSRYRATSKANVYEGYLVAADDKKRYRGTITLKTKNRLSISGCTNLKTSCRKQEWRRLDWSPGS